MSHRMDEIRPSHYVTEEKCKEMIDKAIDRHNKTATLDFCCYWICFAVLLCSGSNDNCR